MGISSKPLRAVPAAPKNLDEFIAKGGGVVSASKPTSERSVFPLRFIGSPDLKERVAQACKRGPGRTSVNTFILQAIAEKLDREGV